MAVKERRKHNNRYRITQRGEVVALYPTKADLEQALATPGPGLRTESSQLLFQMAALPDHEQEQPRVRPKAPLGVDHRFREDDVNSPWDPNRPHDLSADSPTQDFSPVSEPGSDPPSPVIPHREERPDSPQSPVPQAAELQERKHLLSPSGVTTPASEEDPKPAAENRRRRVSFSQAPVQVQVAQEPEEEEEPEVEEESGLQLEKPEETPAIAEALAAKAHLTAPERAARRASLVRPPDAGQMPVGPSEKVLGWFYDDETAAWTCRELVVRIAKEHFAEGAMRRAYRMLLEEDGTEKDFVAKAFGPTVEEEMLIPKMAPSSQGVVLSKSAMADLLKLNQGFNLDLQLQLVERSMPQDACMTKVEFQQFVSLTHLHKHDVSSQMWCCDTASAYNAHKPPQEVKFLPAFLIFCPDLRSRGVFFCEPYLQGNDGSDCNTLQAFSHFSFEHSRKKHIIVDIQGVGDTLTDQHIHSTRISGLGNLGQEGVEAFFKTHECNTICASLGLPQHGR